MTGMNPLPFLTHANLCGHSPGETFTFLHATLKEFPIIKKDHPAETRHVLFARRQQSLHELRYKHTEGRESLST